jgi:hypothetical protein
MLVNFTAHRVAMMPDHFTIDVNLSDFEPGMDADAVRETLEIIMCQDGGCIDVTEEDLYSEAERVYRALNGWDADASKG